MYINVLLSIVPERYAGFVGILRDSDCEVILCFGIKLKLSVLSCQPRVKVASCFVYKVIMELSSIYHLCINSIRRIGLIHK